MAAKTPASVKFLSSGNGISIILASFADIDDGDTWASEINGIVTLVVTDKTGTTTTGLSASFSGTDVTFKTATANKAVDLLIYRR